MVLSMPSLKKFFKFTWQRNSKYNPIVVQIDRLSRVLWFSYWPAKLSVAHWIFNIDSNMWLKLMIIISIVFVCVLCHVHMAFYSAMFNCFIICKVIYNYRMNCVTLVKTLHLILYSKVILCKICCKLDSILIAAWLRMNEGTPLLLFELIFQLMVGHQNLC